MEREQIHKTVDELSPKSLEQLSEFIDLLNSDEADGSNWAKGFFDLLAPVRQGVIESGMTEDEVNQIIDDAIKEVRDERKAKQERVEKG